jgi:hypothetical protein
VRKYDLSQYFMVILHVCSKPKNKMVAPLVWSPFDRKCVTAKTRIILLVPGVSRLTARYGSIFWPLYIIFPCRMVNHRKQKHHFRVNVHKVSPVARLKPSTWMMSNSRSWAGWSGVGQWGQVALRSGVRSCDPKEDGEERRKEGEISKQGEGNFDRI